MSLMDEAHRLEQAKADIKAALEAKGVTVPSDALLGAYAALINSLPNVPALPASDGTYTLSLTIANGEPTFGTWVSNS